jgi:hypothetical protein
MIVVLFGYHSYLIWTSQTTKEHLTGAYQLDPNPNYRHPVVSIWHTLVTNKRQAFTCQLLSCHAMIGFRTSPESGDENYRRNDQRRRSMDCVTIAEDSDHQEDVVKMSLDIENPLSTPIKTL